MPLTSEISAHIGNDAAALVVQYLCANASLIGQLVRTKNLFARYHCYADVCCCGCNHFTNSHYVGVAFREEKGECVLKLFVSDIQWKSITKVKELRCTPVELSFILSDNSTFGACLNTLTAEESGFSSYEVFRKIGWPYILHHRLMYMITNHKKFQWGKTKKPIQISDG